VRVRGKHCYTVSPGTYAIELTQQRRDQFTVQYGRQFDHGLTYAQAAAKLGEAIMHALACEGKLDNGGGT
jgi:hypothetical protein